MYPPSDSNWHEENKKPYGCRESGGEKKTEIRNRNYIVSLDRIAVIIIRFMFRDKKKIWERNINWYT